MQISFSGFGGNSNSQSEERKQRTLQSLMLIMAVYVCSWFLTVSILTIINLPQMSAFACILFEALLISANVLCFRINNYICLKA